MRTLVAFLFDTYINFRFCLAEAARQINSQIEDALDAWGEDEDE